MIVTYFVDPTAIIGDRTKVWHFAVVLADVTIGSDCSIGAGCEIGRGSRIGNHTRIGHGVFLPPNSIVGDYVFIGPGATFTDDKFPRVDNANYDAQPPVIEDEAAIGAGAVVLPGVRIGSKALVAAGAVVTHSVDERGVVIGVPARDVGSVLVTRKYEIEEYKVPYLSRSGIIAKADEPGTQE